MRQRFLNNNDYLGIVTEEALDQLIRGNEERLYQAEEAAEASIIEYLTDNYEVEKELAIGKNLIEYNPKITYPVGAHFYYQNKIWETMRAVNGIKPPTDVIYWEEIEDYDEEKLKNAKQYSQMLNWQPGDIVQFTNAYYECKECNGLDFNDIRIPGVNAWEEVPAPEWQPNLPYQPWEVVKYQDKFYALVDDTDIDLTQNPDLSDNWGLIGTYAEDYNYQDDEHEYVVFKEKVYRPVMPTVADPLQEAYNIRQHDPRNPNLKKHILRLAVYELHKLISPNNVSSARITDYETSIAWLRDANRLKINPQIPRKVDDESKPVAEYAIATFMRDYDPYKNPWQI